MKQHQLDQRIDELNAQYSRTRILETKTKLMHYMAYDRLRIQYRRLKRQECNALRSNVSAKPYRDQLREVWEQLEPIQAQVKRLESNRHKITQP